MNLASNAPQSHMPPVRFSWPPQQRDEHARGQAARDTRLGKHLTVVFYGHRTLSAEATLSPRPGLSSSQRQPGRRCLTFGTRGLLPLGDSLIEEPMKSHSAPKAFWLRRSLLISAALIASIQLVSAEDTSVAAVQEALKGTHFYFGDVNGKWDEATQGALLRFQFRYGLPGTGEMDASTLQALAGNPPPPKTLAENTPAQVERNPEFVRPIEKDGNRTAVKSTASVDPKRRLPASPDNGEHRGVPKAVHTELFLSWSARQRGAPENGVEVRRAEPTATESRNEGHPIPHAIPEPSKSPTSP
jgi:peptidoglycan hydrolase-like protein with peptidoglycan-binding domain